MAECLLCHPAHTPTRVRIPQEMPGKSCQPCHPEVAAKLAATKRRHRNLTCAFCHNGDHSLPPPQCLSCHEKRLGCKKHRKKGKNCVECHKEAHSLS